MSSFSDDMTPEMVADFKKWSRSIGGETEGDCELFEKNVESDIRKYIQLGFCRDEFIKDMEYSWVNDTMFYDPIVEDPEYTSEEWEQAKSDEAREWKIHMKVAQKLWLSTRKERDYYKLRMLDDTLLLPASTWMRGDDELEDAIGEDNVDDLWEPCKSHFGG